MYTTVTVSSDLNRAIMLRSHHDRTAKRGRHKKNPLLSGCIIRFKQNKRTQSQFGTKAYRDALQRAFNKAKMQIFFNPDMQNFITLTYADNMTDIEQCLKDVKSFMKQQRRANEQLTPAGSGRSKPIKYIFIMEYQKRGALHVHMIANSVFTLKVNHNGYNSLVHWTKGFSSILHITDFDNNFRPYLYLFKYMKKSQRIGSSFVHSSRNLNNFTTLEEGSIDLQSWNTLNMEFTETTIENTKFSYYKNYMQYDTLASQVTKSHKGDKFWQTIHSFEIKSW